MAGTGLLVALLAGLAPADAGLFLGASALLAVFLVGIGLLLGFMIPRVGYERGGALLPLVLLVAPATLGDMGATHGWLATVLDLFPSSAAARLIEDSLVGADLYGALPLSMAALGVWAVAPYLVLLALLDRRQLVGARPPESASRPSTCGWWRLRRSQRRRAVRWRTLLTQPLSAY
jgi:hypothetical protein